MQLLSTCMKHWFLLLTACCVTKNKNCIGSISRTARWYQSCTTCSFQIKSNGKRKERNNVNKRHQCCNVRLPSGTWLITTCDHNDVKSQANLQAGLAREPQLTIFFLQWLISVEKPTVETQKAGLGDETKLICRATGNPAPSVSWQKEYSDGSFVPLPGKAGEWVMRSSVIQLPKDAVGTYRCVAMNTEGIDNKTEEILSGE